MEEIEELKKQVKELNKKIEELENKEKSKRWRAEKGHKYYYIDDLGLVRISAEELSHTDSFRYRIRNYFKTGEEAEEHLEKIVTYYELMDLAEELNKGKKIDWDDEEQYKGNIYMSYGELDMNYHSVRKRLGQIYCLDDDFLRKAIDRIGEDRLKKLFV